MGRFRATSTLAAFAGLTVPLMPVQATLLKLAPRAAQRFPHWYHRRVCRLMGLRLHVEGAPVSEGPLLLIANHTSWLDIPVLSAVAPVSFVAKREIGTWPGVSALARLQRTIFVDRERRTTVAHTADEIASRLRNGDAIVLFAEGTSTDGNRVLPFRTPLFSAVKPSETSPAAEQGVSVQCVSIVYSRLHGIPLGRADRSLTGWYGDMDMQTHAWEFLKAGPVDVRIQVSPPVPLNQFAGRKDLAQRTERTVRDGVVRLLRGLPRDAPIETATPPRPRAVPPVRSQVGDGKWR